MLVHIRPSLKSLLLASSLALAATDVMQHADMRMIEVGDGLGFALEALFMCRLRAKLRGQNLDLYSPLKAHIPCTIYLAHPARAQRCKDLIAQAAFRLPGALQNEL